MVSSIGAAWRRTYRLAAMIALLIGGLATVLLVFPPASLAQRDRMVQRWSRMLLAACGVRLLMPAQSDPGIQAARRPGGRMVAANHVSWLDIFVINAAAPSCFIAKSDIAAWPLIGTLVGRVGTIFLERGKRHAVHAALQRVAGQLAGGRRIAVFPEGTTGEGDVLLPFHSNLIQAAVQAKVPIDPVGLRYTGLAGEYLGGPDGAMNYAGPITFVESLWRIVAEPGVLAEVHWLPEQLPDPDPDNRTRHEQAVAARLAISQRLSLPLSDTLPDVVRDLRAGHR